MQLDEKQFRADVAKFVEIAKKASGAPPAPLAVVDQKTALADIKQSFGFVPEFLAKFPAASLAGAWREMRDTEVATTALPGKYKSLVSLAVASQIPCRYCIVVDTELAKLQGATDKEIGEAVAMSGLVRHWSTMMTGLAVDDAQHKKDMERIAKGIASASKTKTAMVK
jgi:AhpD family alkylhydroperoxidase